MRVLFFYCKTCFQKGNLTQILAEVRRIWFTHDACNFLRNKSPIFHTIIADREGNLLFSLTNVVATKQIPLT